MLEEPVKETCETCANATRPVDMFYLWCKIKKQVAPTWYNCDNYKRTYTERKS